MRNSVIDMRIISSTGAEFSFEPDYPLYEKTHENFRLDQQGPAINRKQNIRLDGFFVGNDNREVIARYKELATILNRGEIKFTYKTTSPDAGPMEVVHDQQMMYVESFSEPMDWKQYDGSYTINMYSFVPLVDSELIGIAAVYNGYSFPTVPTWDRSTEPTSQGVNDILLPIDRPTNGTLVSITLKGMLQADANSLDPSANLQAKIASLEDALEADNRKGLLEYGTFGATVRVMGFSIQETIPYRQAIYTINFKYHTSVIFDLRVSRTLSRVHWSPKIKDKPFCGQRSIQFLNRSGQQVTWNLSCSADTIANARAQLETEVEARIVPGGIEIEGGDEKQDENTNTVSLTINRFYNTAILANIGGEGLVVEA